MRRHQILAMGLATGLVAGAVDGTVTGAEQGEPPMRPGDLTGDFQVDIDDVVTLMWSWGPCEWSPCLADLDGDDYIGWVDLMILLSLLDTVPNVV